MNVFPFHLHDTFSLQELDQRYNALLQMYGEKVEEADELKLDLQDVKDMYKAQVVGEPLIFVTFYTLLNFFVIPLIQNEWRHIVRGLSVCRSFICTTVHDYINIA